MKRLFLFLSIFPIFSYTRPFYPNISNLTIVDLKILSITTYDDYFKGILLAEKFNQINVLDRYLKGSYYGYDKQTVYIDLIDYYLEKNMVSTAKKYSYRLFENFGDIKGIDKIINYYKINNRNEDLINLYQEINKIPKLYSYFNNSSDYALFYSYLRENNISKIFYYGNNILKNSGNTNTKIEILNHLLKITIRNNYVNDSYNYLMKLRTYTNNLGVNVNDFLNMVKRIDSNSYFNYIEEFSEKRILSDLDISYGEGIESIYDFINVGKFSMAYRIQKIVYTKYSNTKEVNIDVLKYLNDGNDKSNMKKYIYYLNSNGEQVYKYASDFLNYYSTNNLNIYYNLLEEFSNNNLLSDFGIKDYDEGIKIIYHFRKINKKDLSDKIKKIVENKFGNIKNIDNDLLKHAIKLNDYQEVSSIGQDKIIKQNFQINDGVYLLGISALKQKKYDDAIVYFTKVFKSLNAEENVKIESGLKLVEIYNILDNKEYQFKVLDSILEFRSLDQNLKKQILYQMKLISDELNIESYNRIYKNRIK